MIRQAGKLLHWLAQPAIALVSSRVRPRVRVELRTSDDKVLLVRTWFSQQLWSLPGGGVDRGEAPSYAAVREVHEETGLTIDRKQLEYITTQPAEYPLHCDLVFYTIQITECDLPPQRWQERCEIIDRGWFSIDSLPDDISPLARSITRREFAQD